MLENYTDRAKDLMSDAQNILRRYKHSQLDTEHLLVAMLEDTDGIVTKLLGNLNTDITAVKRVIETNLASTSRTQSSGGREQQIYITPRMKRILDISESEAQRLRDESKCPGCGLPALRVGHRAGHHLENRGWPAVGW